MKHVNLYRTHTGSKFGEMLPKMSIDLDEGGGCLITMVS